MPTRIPRPHLSTNINRTNKQNLVRHILLHYVSNNYTVCNQSISLTDLAYSLQVTYAQLLKELLRINRQLGAIYSHKGNAQERSAGLLFRCLENATMDRGLIHQQLSLLLSSQGDGYKPFISSEVTKALQTLLASNKNMADIVKSLMPSGPQTVAFINNQNMSGTQPNPTSDKAKDYLTIQAANDLIQGLDYTVLDPKSLPNPTQGLTGLRGLGLSEISVPDDYPEVPEIDARRQFNMRAPGTHRDDSGTHEILPNDVDD